MRVKLYEFSVLQIKIFSLLVQMAVTFFLLYNKCSYILLYHLSIIYYAGLYAIETSFVIFTSSA